MVRSVNISTRSDGFTTRYRAGLVQAMRVSTTSDTGIIVIRRDSDSLRRAISVEGEVRIVGASSDIMNER
jgi:hypothetical protein